MNIEEICETIGISGFKLINRGLSTTKLKVDDRLYRIHNDHDRAVRERTALRLLSDIECDIEFPELLEFHNLHGIEVNVVRWIHGRTAKRGEFQHLLHSLKTCLEELPRSDLPLHSILVENYLKIDRWDTGAQEDPRAEDVFSINSETWDLYRSLGTSEDSAVVHGDLHRMNILKTGDGHGVIDWEFAAWGNPDFDIAYFYAYSLKTPDFVNRVESARALLVMSIWFQRRALTKLEEGQGVGDNVELARKYLDAAWRLY